LYDLYKSEKDTVNCGNILKKGLAAFPDNEDLMSTQIDYYDMTGQSDKVLALCDSMLAKKPGDLTVAANCANYMSNAKYFTKAEEILTGLLAEHPNDFQLNFQMAYRYTMEVVEYEDKIDAAMKAKQYGEVNPLKTAEKEVLQKAHDWSQKAYEIDPDNRQNNITLQQLKVKLLLPVPEELKAKVDSYRHQK
jgi:predicted Zn-dependent protease